ncbi:MAG: condensation domain-containing protein, partial [Acidobacteriota bacterium]
QPGARLYKTGDLVRYLSCGNVEFLGRIDHQVKIHGFRVELGEIEAAINEHNRVREALVIAYGDSANKRLAAYIVCEPEQAITQSELRSFLMEKLPVYMVPSVYLFLDALPLTSHGKFDRRALPEPDQIQPEQLQDTSVVPRTQAEKMLATIWSQVIGVEHISVYDNFFALGGDSILSIQIVAKANRLGLRISPKQIFQYQTIAELAAVVGTTTIIEGEQGIVSGEVPLTPIQHIFFAQELSEPYHYNQALLLTVRKTLDVSFLEKAIQHLLIHHDALRLRFVQSESGWQQFYAEPINEIPLLTVDLSAMSEQQKGIVIEETAAQLQASLDFTNGPLLRVAFFNMGIDQPGRLLIIIHHLAVDGVSWRILLEDLQLAYDQLSMGEEIILPSKTTSYKSWATRLNEYADSPVLQQELDYWLKLSCRAQELVSSLPTDYSLGPNSRGSACTISFSLSAAETTVLLQEVPEVYHTQVNDLLLTALVLTLSQWSGKTLQLISLEGHGREEIFEGVDTSRTVGWFTTLFPVLLEMSDLATVWDSPGDLLKALKEQLRGIPNNGIGYGLLRYLSNNNDIRKQLQSLAWPAVNFNYLGQFDQVLSESSPFELALESGGLVQSPLGLRRHLFEITARVIDSKLQVDWTYSENYHRQATVTDLANGFIQALRTIISHCQSLRSDFYTPSDFPLSNLDQKQIDILFAQLSEDEE